MKNMFAFLCGLFFLFNFICINAATLAGDSRKISPPVYVSKTSTSMNLSASKGRVFLDVKPAPVKIHFYTGERRLGSLAGKSQTRFDITNYAARADNGQLRVVTYDDKGKQIARILDVSRYIKDSSPARPDATSQSKQPQKGSKQFQMIEPALKKDTSPSADFDGSSKSVRQSDKRVSPKVGLFLDKIKQANSLEELKHSYNGTEFSNREIDQLTVTIKENQYLNKLKGIAQRELSEPSALPGRQTLTVKKKKPGTKQSGTVTKSHSQHLQKIRKDIALQKTRIKARESNTFIAQDRQSSTESSSPQSGMTSPPVRSSPNWLIDSVSPSSVQIGKNVTLTGSGFGVTQGLVALRFHDRTTGLRALVNCDRIVSWSDNRIIVTIPAGAAIVVGDTNTNASIWVKVAGGEVGPWHEISLRPDFSLLPPEITTVSHHDVIPDQPYLIQGTNFLSSQQGEVFFRFAGKEFPAIISSWENKLIEVQVPPIVGLLRTPGNVLVRNHAGYDASFVVTFLPTIWGEDIYGPGDHGFDDIVINVRCTPWFGPTGYYDYDGDNPAWLLCLFGQKRENQVRIRLNNGWTVSSGHVELRSGRGWQNRPSCGAYYERGPVHGSDYIDVLRVTWTNAYSKCEFIDYYSIEGPAGVSHIASSEYNPELACINTRNRRDLQHLRDSPVNCNNVRWQ